MSACRRYRFSSAIEEVSIFLICGVVDYSVFSFLSISLFFSFAFFLLSFFFLLPSSVYSLSLHCLFISSFFFLLLSFPFFIFSGFCLMPQIFCHKNRLVEVKIRQR